MNLCSTNHEEVCFESRKCPVCELLSETETQIENLKLDIENLKEECAELEKQLPEP